MYIKISRETLHEILRTMLQDTLVAHIKTPAFTGGKGDYHNGFGDGYEAGALSILDSDAVILVCVGNYVEHVSPFHDSVNGKDFHVSWRGSKNREWVLCNCNDGEDCLILTDAQLCNEVRAALGVSHV